MADTWLLRKTPEAAVHICPVAEATYLVLTSCIGDAAGTILHCGDLYATYVSVVDVVVSDCRVSLQPIINVVL